LRTISWLASLGGVPVPIAVACATGNTASARRLNTGFVRCGAPADLLIADAPSGSQGKDFQASLRLGDTPAVSGVIIDGSLVMNRSRNSPPPVRPIEVR